MKSQVCALLALASIGLASASETPGRVPTPAEIQTIVTEGKDKSQVMQRLRELTNIGPRLTGSTNLSKAQNWAMGQFKKWGLKNVHLDEWGTIPVGFERGSKQSARMVEPFDSEIVFTTPAWTPGTKGKVRGQAFAMPTSMEELNKLRPQLKNSFILMPARAGMRGATIPADEINTELDKAGIAGRIAGAADERVHTSGTWRDKTFEKRPTQTLFIVRKSDYERIARNIEYGRNPILELEAENKWIKGPIKQYNVVAEIEGTDLKDEVVVICGHLDSWNSPGSQGACDNGTGTVSAMESARILAASGLKPRRTIRFILWSGEEQGLLGSRAYVEKQKEGIEKFVAVLNDDGGTNYHGGYVGLESHRAILEKAFAPTLAAFPDLPMKFDAVAQDPAGGSSDHAPFIWAGVPAYFTKESGRADYGFVWHTQHDRYENAIPEYLVQSATNHALVVYHLATIDGKLERFPVRPRNSGAVVLNHALAMGADRMYADPHAHGSNDNDHDHEDDYVLEIFDRLKRIAPQVMRAVAR